MKTKNLMKNSVLKDSVIELKKTYKKFPNQPGVYIFSDQKSPLYVGKAKDLKKRVGYYFKIENLPKRLARMVHQATQLQYFITESEHDAFLLEAQFIKEKRPIYNILYKEGRSLYYIDFSKSKKNNFPRVQIMNEWSKSSIGPFLSVEYINNLLSELLKIFKIRTCTDYVFAHRKRPCLEYYSNRCSAPCVGLIQEDEYQKNLTSLFEFFNGKGKKILLQWEKDLKLAIKNESFEQAAQIRNKIIAAEKLQLKQGIHFENIHRLDIIARYKNYFYVESIKNGAVINIEYRKYEKNILLSEFLWDFYITEPTYRVIGPEAENTLYKNYSSKLNKIEKKIYENTQKRMYALIEQETHENHWKEILGVENLNSIEVYDSSHYNSKNALCGMVFYDGQQFVKNRYRYWKLPQNSANDLEILAHSLNNRFKKGELSKITLLDGGITQLNLAHKILCDINEERVRENLEPFQTKLLAFAKGERRKGGTVYEISSETNKWKKVKITDELMLFFEKLRDEAHRWAKKNASNLFTKGYIHKS